MGARRRGERGSWAPYHSLLLLMLFSSSFFLCHLQFVCLSVYLCHLAGELLANLLAVGRQAIDPLPFSSLPVGLSLFLFFSDTTKKKWGSNGGTLTDTDTDTKLAFGCLYRRQRNSSTTTIEAIETIETSNSVCSKAAAF